MSQSETLMQQNTSETSRGVAKGAAFASASSFFSEAAATEEELMYIVGHCWQVGLSMPNEAYLFHKQLCVLGAA